MFGAAGPVTGIGDKVRNVAIIQYMQCFLVHVHTGLTDLEMTFLAMQVEDCKRVISLKCCASEGPDRWR